MIITYITEPTVYNNEVAFDSPQQHQVAEQMVAAHALRVMSVKTGVQLTVY